MKNKSLYTVIFFLVWTLSLAAQPQVPKKCYLHLSGTINHDLMVTVNLVKVNDSLYGDLACKMNAPDLNTYNIYYGSPKVVAGKVNSDGTFWMKEPFTENAPVFRGTFGNGQTLKGTWESGKERKKLPFELKETYAGGVIPFAVYTMKDMKGLVKSQRVPGATLSLTLLIPSESTNPVINDSITPLILKSFSNRKIFQSTPDQLLAGIRQSYFDDYMESNETLFKEQPDAASLNWELTRHMHILYNSGTILSFYILSYAFTGGAHGLESQDFFSMDVKTGKLLKKEDLFVEGSEQELSRLLTAKLHEQDGIKMGSKLSESGYFVDEIKPNDNFYLTGNGIGFFYNHYEIAPYSNGFTDIFLTFSELKSILK
jgi:hypothetical protein